MFILNYRPTAACWTKSRQFFIEQEETSPSHDVTNVNDLCQHSIALSDILKNAQKELHEKCRAYLLVDVYNIKAIKLAFSSLCRMFVNKV